MPEGVLALADVLAADGYAASATKNVDHYDGPIWMVTARAGDSTEVALEVSGNGLVVSSADIVVPLALPREVMVDTWTDETDAV